MIIERQFLFGIPSNIDQYAEEGYAACRKQLAGQWSTLDRRIGIVPENR